MKIIGTCLTGKLEIILLEKENNKAFLSINGVETQVDSNELNNIGAFFSDMALETEHVEEMSKDNKKTLNISNLKNLISEIANDEINKKK